MTLVELMVVVAIIAGIAVVGMPLLLRKLDRAPADRAPAAPPAAAPTRPATVTVDRRLPVPRLRDARVVVRLEPHHRLHGLTAHTAYTARVQARYRFTADDAGRGRLRFAFPELVSEAWDASLKLDGREPAGAVYSRGGIEWSGPMDRRPLVAEVSYAVRGRERFEITLPGRGRSGRVQVELKMAGLGSELVPETSLQPTAAAPGQLSWRFANLVTDRRIVVELPAATTPVGRLLLLSKLVGLAVLLFGAGFWYLSERRSPGALAAFRWPHFLLLALNYSLFFIAFAVLGFDQERPWTALGMAGALSLPPLLLHVGRLADWRFSLSRGAPLTLLSLAVVLWGVYAPGSARYFYVGLSLVAVAFVTVTFPRWSAARRRERERRAAADRRHRRDDEAREAVEAMAGLAEELGLARKELDPDEVSEAERYLLELEAQRRELASLSTLDEDELHRQRASRLVLQARRLRRLLEHARDGITRALERQLAATEREARCPSCGAATLGDAAYCSACGAPRPLVLDCQRCGESLTLLPLLLRHSWRQRPIHCARCGARHQPEG